MPHEIYWFVPPICAEILVESEIIDLADANGIQPENTFHSDIISPVAISSDSGE